MGSILDDIDTQLQKFDTLMELMEKKETLIFGITVSGSVNRVVTDQNLPVLLESSFRQAVHPLLSRCKNRKIVSIDCRTLRKGDAYGWMVSLSVLAAESSDLIVIVENITEIPAGPQCDDPQYVENLLGHSWKNGIVCFNGSRIDATNMTIILTSVPEHKEEFGSKYRTDGFAWFEDFDMNLEKLNNQINNL